MKPRKGVTLLELTIGLFLIGSILAIYLQSMQASKKKNEFYSEHFIASIMAGKVVESCFQETDLNPFGIEALGLSDDGGTTHKFSSMITEGQTVFFKDPIISKDENKLLYEMFSKDFILNVNTEKNKKSFFTTSTAFNWKASTGQGNFTFQCAFPGSSLKQEAISSFAFPEAQLEKKLVERFFEEKDKSLGAIISSPAAAEVAKSTGRIYFSASALFGAPQIKKAFERIEKARTETYAPGTKAYFNTTEAYFSVARDILDLIVFLEKDITRLKNDIKMISSMNLRTRSRLEVFISKAGHSLVKMRQLFLICVNEAASRYRAQLKASDSPKFHRQIIEKCLGMHRLMVVSTDFCDGVFSSENAENIVKSEYYDFLSTLEKYYSDKETAIVRLAKQEKRFAETGVLTDRYFTCKLVKQLFKLISDLKEILPIPDPGAPDPDPSVIGKASGNGTIAGAITWAYDQLQGGTGKGVNANNGQMVCNNPAAWNDWCLAFVNTAYNRTLEELRVGSAITSYENWQRKGKINTNKQPPAGAILYTSAIPGNPHGHIFLASGKTNENGEPLVITSGTTGFDGIREMTLDECIQWTGGSYLGWVLPEVK